MSVDIEPWGSHRNFAADQLGVWRWNGERDVFGRPCRWRLHFVCHECAPVPRGDQGDYRWTLDWPQVITDGCPVCGRHVQPLDAEDLTLDWDICPDNQFDDVTPALLEHPPASSPSRR